MTEAKGKNGQVQFDGRFVTITRIGFRARISVGKGEKRIHIASISSVQWKPAGPFSFGFIQFGMAGANEVRSRFGSQSSGAAKDENSVTFGMAQQSAFEELRNAVDEALAAQHERR